MRRLTGVDEAWLRGLIPLSAEERIQRTLATFAPVLQQRWLTALLESPLHLVSIGVNFAQKSKMLRMEGADSTVEFLLMYFMRLAQTDLGRNWFAWHAIAGHFDHHAEGAVPPYLRRGHHERSYRSPTQVRYHRRNIFEVLGDGGKDQWSHFTFCDAPDWMTDEAQQRLFREVLRTGREGGVLQYRSVERDSLVARHGLDRHLVPMREETASATAADRTRQYRGVNFYRIVH
jgi:S-adenosylmethionine-diacylglycerol 3-amino-3-carboxypropyl transferase